QKLSSTLGDADVAVGNLEGAINSDHLRTPEGSLAFSFTPGTSRTLAESHFAILSLANNHTYDFGENGLPTPGVISRASPFEPSVTLSVLIKNMPTRGTSMAGSFRLFPSTPRPTLM